MEFMTFILCWTGLFMGAVIATPFLFAHLIDSGPTTPLGRWGRRFRAFGWLFFLGSLMLSLGWMTVISGAQVDRSVAAMPLVPLCLAFAGWLVESTQPHDCSAPAFS
eukprot:TRINITY_DN15371_c0_g1_i1.p2 TRINITY_DN15371_c0_g1~~TRINITY_DN15371_c0_g1_i1.p2  ORF type:complete len:117 (+),score=9.44 TRINITY_DN15371_c0_g1_i1:32-352(+)